MDRKIEFIVNFLDEERSRGSAVGPYIPTLGAATTSIDLYRIAGVYESNLHDLGVAFTDVSSVCALSKIAEGNIQTVDELEAAEVALQALMFHEVVDIFTCGPKIQNEFHHYLRLDSGQRSKFGFDLMSVAGSQDFLFAPELFEIRDGSLVETRNPNSPLNGLKVDDVHSIKSKNAISSWNKAVADDVEAALQDLNIPIYLSSRSFNIRRRGDDFAKTFYNKIRLSWDKAMLETPPIYFSFVVPLFVGIVLNRLQNRQDLKKVIADLREELTPVRAELRTLNSMIGSSISQAEIENRIRHFQSAVEGVFPESRLSNAERRRRKINKFFAFTKSVFRPLYELKLHNIGYNYLQGMEAAGGELRYLQSRVVTDRFVTTRVFSNLIKTESIQSLAKLHFSPSEIRSIEMSASRRS